MSAVLDPGEGLLPADKPRLTLREELRRRWWAYLIVVGIWLMVCVRLFVDPTPRLPVMYNTTPSLPFKLAVTRYGVNEYVRGDYVVYAFNGSALKTFPGLRNQPFFKRIVGVPGDRVTVRGREVFVNGASVGVAKTYAPKRMVLDPIGEIVIPAGFFYVAGTDADSFDSRYRQSGLVRKDQILHAVLPLF